VQRNLTLTLDAKLLRDARKIAVERDTSVNQMVREYLGQVVQEADRRRAARSRMEEIFRTFRIDVGRRKWKREDLYDRRG
jgi:hypothetical protein